jgi:CelD/BcsL family acetyltransferase involved in cellulose biosynthesis
MGSAQLIERVEELAPWVDRWDEMAVSQASPFASPKWLLPWLAHALPERSELRTVVVSDGPELLGVAPFYAQWGRLGRVDYRLVGAGLTQRRSLIAKPGHEDEVADAVAATIGKASPRPDLIAFEAIDGSSDWPERLARNYPAPIRPRVVRRDVAGAPTIALQGLSFDEWLAGKSGNFRQQMRRMRRQLEGDGGHIRLTQDDGELDRDVDSFMRLHLSRWEDRGGSSLAGPGVPAMLKDVGRRLLADNRFRLWTVEIDDKAIATGLFIGAGGELAYFNGGFDEDYARYKPNLVAIMVAIEDACELGTRRLDLQGGVQPYKLRFADADDPIAWVTLRPLKARTPLTRAQTLRADLRWHARNALSDGQRVRLKRLLRR